MKIPQNSISHSTEQTEAFGKELALAVLDNAMLPRFIALYGDLGVGKTAFVRGFTAAIAPSVRVKSPTFALVNEYKGEKTSVFHFDMYRINSEDELYSIGFYDYLDRNGICLVEWSENIEYALPEKYFRVELKKCPANNADMREISVLLVGWQN